MTEKSANQKQIISIKDIAFISITAALIAVCSWITIPYSVPFTMQTFAVFFALRLLGGKRGLISIITYILTGLVGAPVFSGFKGGIGVIIGPTGGYIIGFIFTALLYWAFEKKTTNKFTKYAVLISGLMICYLFGTVQFVFVMKTSSSGFMPALMTCVVPYIIPDILKMILADFTAARTAKVTKIRLTN